MTAAVAAGALVGLGLALVLAGLVSADPPSSTGSLVTVVGARTIRVSWRP